MRWRMRHEDVDEHTNAIARDVVDAAFKVRRHLGVGLLESVYTAALCAELVSRGYVVSSEVPVPAIVDGKLLPVGFRADIIVNGRVLVEVKAAAAVRPEHVAQLLTYLSFAKCEVGILINFNEPFLKNGIRRRVWSGPSRS